MAEVHRWRWVCSRCAFTHISECGVDEINETLNRGAMCPMCREKLIAPAMLSEDKT